MEKWKKEQRAAMRDFEERIFEERAQEERERRAFQTFLLNLRRELVIEARSSALFN